MSFTLDERITTTCFELGEWPLSTIFLKNNANYPWFIMVPRQENVREIDQLSPQLRQVFIDEVSQLSSIVRSYFKADKINVAALGNVVPQLHVHVVARFVHDHLWPQGVWQSTQPEVAYTEAALEPLLVDLRNLI